MNEKIKAYISDNKEFMLKTLKELCLIPAPSHFEHKRAEYCKKWLEDNGAAGVYIDEALNVVFPLNCEQSNDITVYAAHTDTVFPDTEPMPYIDDGERIYSPGVSDDTASVIVLLYTAKYFIENNIIPKNGILFVCNSCEEGLGNLKGTRQLFKDYSGRIGRFITFDSNLNSVSDRTVGSHRYEVEVLTEGGHSFGDFGNDNAINELSKMVAEIYKITVPQKEGTKTTYNVGSIMGGTSVNTIAQSAKMLCEYRSDDRECLDIMKEKFMAIFENARSEKIEVKIKLVGDRPCSNIDFKKVEHLKELIVPVIEDVVGEKLFFKSSSTDCNIPLSLGVSALCIGTNYHGKVHTREEWLDKKSMNTGLEVAIKTAYKLMEDVL